MTKHGIKPIRHGNASLLVIVLLLAMAFVAANPVGVGVVSASDRHGGAWYGDGSYPLVETADGAVELNIYGPSGLMAGRGGEPQHFLVDHLGSTRSVLNGNNGSDVHHEYAPYGTAVSLAGETAARYAGHPYDASRGIYVTPNRGYDATFGRFLSVDSRREGAGLYSYATGNPIGYVDPSGSGGVPFFVRSGFGDPDYVTVDPANRSLAVGLGSFLWDHLYDATEIFGKPNTTDIFGNPNTEVGRSAASRNPYRVLEKTSAWTQRTNAPGNKKSYFNDKLYWIVGDDRSVDVPSDIEGGIRSLQQVDPKFANDIVLIDVSATMTEHQPIARALSAIGIDYRVVQARMLFDMGRSNHLVESRAITDSDYIRSANDIFRRVIGMEHEGRSYGIRQFRRMVESGSIGTSSSVIESNNPGQGLTGTGNSRPIDRQPGGSMTPDHESLPSGLPGLRTEESWPSLPSPPTLPTPD